MKIAAILPVRSLGAGKTRLAGILTEEERAALNGALLVHTLSLAAAFPGPRATYLTSPDPRALRAAEQAGMRTVEDRGSGLNAALEEACGFARRGGAARLVILPVDIPLALPQDVLAIAGGTDPVVIAPDRRDDGTNALCIASDIEFVPRFGPESAAAHAAEAERTGQAAAIRVRRRLTLDIDTETDWEVWGRTANRAAWIRARRILRAGAAGTY